MHDMDLEFTEHVRNTIFLIYKQKKAVEILIFGTFYRKKPKQSNFGLYFAESQPF